MKLVISKVALAICAGLCVSASDVIADVKPADMFADGMVLQREMPVPVWGRAEAGEQVTVRFAGQGKSCTADKHGESNSRNPKEYAESLPCWVRHLHKLWNKDDFYFLAVMLPGLARGVDAEDPNADSNSRSWIREAQMKVLDLPYTSVSNSIDLGDLNNGHPKDKAPIAKRLALLAQRNVYGANIVAQGPIFEMFAVDGDKMIIKFNTAEGLKTKDGHPPKAFWIAGKDKSWHRATAEIKGSAVVVKSEKVSSPVACRYAFSAMPRNNLINDAGLPALPFRTDDWEMPEK